MRRLKVEHADIALEEKQRDENKRVANLAMAKRESQRKKAEVERLEAAVAKKAMLQKKAEDDALMAAYSGYVAAKGKHILNPSTSKSPSVSGIAKEFSTSLAKVTDKRLQR